MTRVKICGLSERGHILAAAEAGADYIGFVFAESRRRISPQRAAELTELVMGCGNRPLCVGVFAGSHPSEVNRVAEVCHLDYVQLSGGESACYSREIQRPVIKVFHVSPDTRADALLIEMERYCTVMKDRELVLLLDTAMPGKSGGTGITFNWGIASAVAARFPVIVAGGLNPDNVARLVSQVRPWGVDVSGGVETDGKKDVSKIRLFIEAVKREDMHATR